MAGLDQCNHEGKIATNHDIKSRVSKMKKKKRKEQEIAHDRNQDL